MDKHHLSIDDFFVRLAELFHAQNIKGSGSVFLTQKRLSPPDSGKAPGAPGHPDDFSDLNPPAPVPVLVRATNGKPKEKRKDKIKISTVVQPEELEMFFTRYTDVCKSGMSGLKKRNRSGAKAKARAKKKKEKGAVGERK